MTKIVYTFVALPFGDPTEGVSVIHAHVSIPRDVEMVEGWDESPKEQRKATKEAMHIIREIVCGNREYIEDEERLFKGDQPIPENARRLMMFEINVTWKNGEPKFKNGDYARWDFDKKWNDFVPRMFSMRETTIGVLRNNIRKQKEARDDK